MGLLSGLATLGGFALAPFTGGASIPIGQALGGALGAVGKGAGAMADTAAQNRSVQAQLEQMRDRNRVDAESEFQRALAQQAQIELARRQADRETRDSGYREALRSQYLQNWTPASRPKGIETIRGGFNTVPEASRQTAAEMERQAMLRLLNGEQFDPMEAPQRVQMSEIPRAGKMEKIGGVLAAIGGAADYANQSRQQSSIAERMAEILAQSNGNGLPGFSGGFNGWGK